MGKMEKTREQLTRELAQAQQRIAELEATASTSGKISSLYHGIFENFVESATDSFSIWDSNLNLIYINEATMKYHPAGTRKSDVIGKNIKEMIPDCEKSGRYTQYKHVLNTGEPIVIEDFKADPKYGDIYLSIKVFKISDGIGIVSSDVTERRRMEQALKDSQQRLNAVIENAPDAILTYDTNGRFTSGNKRAEEILGYTKEEMVGKTFAESGMFTAESLAKTRGRLAEYKDGKETEPLPYELVAKGGSHVFVEVRGVPIVQCDKVEVIAIARDITERMRMEETLRQSEEKLRAIFESISDSITVIDGSGSIIEVNDAAIKLFGCKSREEALGTQALSFIAEEDQPSAIGKLQESKPTRFIEYRYKRMDGSLFWGETSSDVLYDKSGNITGFIGIVRDITERKKAEDALRKSEERLRTYFENAPDAIFVYDFNGVFLDGNRKGEEITGYRKDDLIGKNFIESGLFSEEYGLKAMNAVLKDMRSEVTSPEEYVITRKDGQKRVLESTSFVVRGKWKGEVVGIARDVTDRKKMEEELKQSEEKLRAILESIGNSITVIDINGNIIDLNDAAVKLFGCKDKGEVLGMNALTFMAEESQPSAAVKLNAAKTERLIQYKFKRMDGSTFWGETSTDAIHNSSGEIIGFVAIIMDITERKALEDKLRQSEEKIRQVFNSVGVGITVTNMEGKVVDMNDVGLRLCGYGKDELLGRNGISIIAERDRPRIIEEMIRAFQTGKSGINEFTALKADGTEYAVEAIATVMRDYSGNPEGLIISITDITERKRIERELNDYKANLEDMVNKRTAELEKTYQELRESEERLRNSEEKLRAIFEAIGDGIAVCDLNGKLIDINTADIKLFGFESKDQLTNLDALSFVSEADRARVTNDIATVATSGQGMVGEYRLVNRYGREFNAEVRGSVLRNISGETTAIVNVIRDITERKRMEEALKESEGKYRSLVEQLSQGIVIMQDNRIVFANNAMTQINGYSIEEMMAMSPEQVINIGHPESRERLASRIDERMQGKVIPEHSEWRILRRDGTEKWLEAHATRIIFNGKPAIQATLLDISERKKMENALRNSEEKLRTMFTSMADGVVVTNLEGNFKDANTAALKMFGYSSKEDVRDANGFDFIAEKDRDLAMQDMAQLFNEGLVTGRSWTFKHSSGTEFQAELNTALLKDPQGNPAEILVVMRDITTRKRIEESLRKSEEKLRIMFSSMADGVVVTGLDGKIMDLNEAQLRLFGYDRKEDALGENGFIFMVEKDRDAAMKDISSLLKNGVTEERSFRFTSKKGREFIAEISSSLLYDASGNPTDIMCVVRDITERKRMEEALRASEAKLRAIYDSIEDGITVTDLKGTIIDENKAGLRLSGYTRKAEVAGRNGLSFIAEADRDRARNDMFNVLQKGIGIQTEYKLVDRNGKEFDAEVSGAIIPNSEGKPAAIVNVIRDITERKHIEEALRESEAKYRTLVEQSEQGICILQESRIVFANNALSRINGYSLKEMYAMSPEESLSLIHPDDREEYVRRVRNRLNGAKMMSRHEYRSIRKDGTERILETFAKLITYQGKPAIQSTVADITERKQWEERLNKSKDEMRFYLNQITKAQEEERKKIARELHDDTIQELITLSRQIDDLIDKNIKPDQDRRISRKKIETTRDKVDTILQGVRRFTRDLRPSLLDDLGLVPALEWLTTDTSARFGIPINISIVGTEHPTTPDAALAMFRIAQESLRNAGQHSKASQIQLNLKYSSKTATLSIIDDGVGFTPPKQTTNLTRLGKLGIAGMHERAQLIGATLSIKSKRNKGTTVTLEVPIKL